MSFKPDIPDKKERETALDPARSFIVQAPAGSGKTELLIRRFLRLLAMVDQPEQMLAITFTRKAAGEMHSRVMKAIEAARDGEIPESKHEREGYELACAALKRDREKGWNLLNCPARLKVQTIDALCAALTRQMPILSGLGRLPAITEDPTVLYREAARRTIALMEKDGPEGHTVRQALRHLDNNFASLEKRLISMLARRDQWLRHIRLKEICSDEELKIYLEESLQRSIEGTLRQVQQVLPDELIKESLACGRYAASNLAADNVESHIRSLDAGQEPDFSHTALPLWRGIGALLLTGKGEWRKTGGVNKKLGFPPDKTPEALEVKDRFKLLLDGLAGQERLEKVLAEVVNLPDGRYGEKEWTILKDLLHLLPLAQHLLQGLFGEEGVVDFQAVALAAISALGDASQPTDLMLALDLRLRHILVDEYQDTSQLQLKLLEALTAGWEEGDGRTLFVVGDPMQSIYLFREAEVGLFLQAESNGIGSVKLEPLKLKSNFRSQAGIVEWANATFSAAFPAEGDRLLGAIPYSPFSPVLQKLDSDAAVLSFYETREDELEAEHIVQTILLIREKLPDNTVAVLARSRTHLTKLIELIKKEGIDFRTTDLDPLIERPVIQDLLSLLRALMHPCDRTAWLAVLRAPWCGLTIADIHRLINGEKKIIWEAMGDESLRALLSEDGRQRLIKLYEKLALTITLWGRRPPRKLLEGIWISIGGPACVDADGIEDGDAFFDMLEKATLAGRLESIDILEERITKLHANHGGMGDNPVDIMTIHRSKGLEFDHVVLPGLGKSPPHREKRLIYAMESGKDLFLAPIEETGKDAEGAIYRYLDRMQGKKELLEQVRLLYVAITRAKKRLYLFGHVRGLKDESPRIEERSFLASMRQLVSADDLIAAAEEKDEGAVTSKPFLPLRRISSGWEIPEAPEAVYVEGVESRLPESVERPEFAWAGEAIRHLGTAVHRYLCRITMEGLGSWDRQRLQGESGRLTAILRELGLSSTEAESIAGEGLEILCRAIDDKKGRWVLDQHKEARAEMPLSSASGGKVVRRVIDRTFVDDNGVRWIIDYKVSRHDGSDINRFLLNEKERYRAQLDRYEEILKAGGEIRQIKKGLYYPAQSGWIEW